MRQRWLGAVVVMCVMGVGIIGGCGSASYARLDLTLTVTNALGEHTYTKMQDATAAQLYYHTLQARKPDPNTYLSCPTPRAIYVYHFAHDGKAVVDAQTGACYMLKLSDQTVRLPDAGLWDLTSQFAGQDVAPN